MTVQLLLLLCLCACSNPPRSVHVAVASYGSETNPFGSWWLNHQEQERFTDVGLYVVTLAFQDGVLQQVCAGCTRGVACGFLRVGGVYQLPSV